MTQVEPGSLRFAQFGITIGSTAKSRRGPSRRYGPPSHDLTEDEAAGSSCLPGGGGSLSPRDLLDVRQLLLEPGPKSLGIADDNVAQGQRVGARPPTHRLLAGSSYPLSTRLNEGWQAEIGDPFGTPFGFCFTNTPREACAFTPESSIDENPSPCEPPPRIEYDGCQLIVMCSIDELRKRAWITTLSPCHAHHTRSARTYRIMSPQAKQLDLLANFPTTFPLIRHRVAGQRRSARGHGRDAGEYGYE